MKRILSLTLFVIAIVFNLKAQRELEVQREADTSQPEVSLKASKNALMLYLNGGTSFATGGNLPQTYQEYEIATNGLPCCGSIAGVNYNRTGVSHTAGECYGMGLEFVPGSRTPFFNVIDLGVEECNFGGNVYDNIIQYIEYPNYTISSSSIEATPYTCSYYMGELAAYQFCRFLKKGNKRLSLGFGVRVAYAFSVAVPDFEPQEEPNPSALGFFGSTRLRYKSKFISLDLFADWGSCYGVTFASAGIQFAVALTPH